MWHGTWIWVLKLSESTEPQLQVQVLEKNLLIEEKSIAVDLKSEKGVEIVLKLVANSDAIFEGFRPGVMERLGLGPEIRQARNEKIVYEDDWMGQTGPLPMRLVTI